MGGHDHELEKQYMEIPDYRCYKVEDVPKLLLTQKVLASQGLCDPWLRNEVWRYNTTCYGTEGSRAKSLFFRGFRIGLVACILTLIGTSVYDRMYPSSHEHVHGQKSEEHGHKSDAHPDKGDKC